VKRKAPRRPHIPPAMKPPTVVVKKLRKYHAWANNTKHEVELDSKLSGRAKLEALCHEFCHLYAWAAPEGVIRRLSRDLSTFLHKNNVRIIEPGNSPLDLE
jgi:hypothetical protein